MQFFDLVVWYAWAQAFALGGWLIAARWLRNLPDRGYGIGKALGLLLGSFAYWALVTLGFAHNNTGAALLGLAAVLALAIVLVVFDGRRKTQDAPVLRPASSVIIVTELLFALGFIAWAVVRSYSPDIQSAGGEKFMESMMINAILRSPAFPPNDAWLAGASISYYYFGYILFAMLIQLSGVASALAFNLGAALVFALTLTSAFSLGYNLWNLRFWILDLRLVNVIQSKIGNRKSAIAAGLLTAVMLALMGNLGGLMGALKCANALPQGVWEWLDVRDTASQAYTCSGLAPNTFYGWWWDWSRVVKDTTPAGGYQEIITESPIFSFVLGDNHPHVVALPFVLIGLTLALSALLDSRKQSTNALRTTEGIISLALTAIVLGGLSFMNTWDFPIYGTLFIAASLLGRWLRREPLLPALAYGVGAMALGYLIYTPWAVTFASQARGIGVNLFNGTRFSQFFLMFAPFLIAAAGFIWLIARETPVRARSLAARAAGLTALVIIAGLAAVALFGFLSPEARALAQELNTTGAALGVTREQITARLTERATSPWTVLALGGGAAVCAVLILAQRREDQTRESADVALGASNALDAFVLMLFGAGAVLTLAVEFVFLRDLFSTRMNTVFKLYYQAWALWAVAGAYAIVRLVTAKGIAAKTVGGVALVFVAFGLLWPLMAVPARSEQFSATPALDGMAHVRRDHPDDAKLIDWLNANVPGDAHIVEASTLHAYQYVGRISAFTGLPTVLGWGGHQHQWRGTFDEAARRHALVERIYNTGDIAEARALMDEFDVRYVIIGDTERGTYSADGLAKFETMCRPAFQSGNSTIYRCAGSE
jgi:YYY domain-containing protein